MKLGVVMDPIGGIQPAKDSTLAMLLAAQRRGWPCWYLELGDLFLEGGQVHGRMRPVQVRDDLHAWHELGAPVEQPLTALDMLLMRKDPPFDLEYLYATHLLSLAQAQGLRVVNDPRALRDCNEKLFTAWFPHCCPPTLVSRDLSRLLAFIAAQGVAVVKPLDGMGGGGVFKLAADDVNRRVALETLSQNGRRSLMAQRYLPEIARGDKRILVVHGQAVPYALARIPAADDFRGNLAAGARGEGRPLSERDRWLVAQVAPELLARGLLFVGLDVIGDYITEINVTSPTCIRELDRQYGLDIAGQFLDGLSAA
jgi:glutathione synthase